MVALHRCPCCRRTCRRRPAGGHRDRVARARTGQVRVKLPPPGSATRPVPGSTALCAPVPAVLGHEGAGTVLAVGEGVTRVAPGDDVVLNWAPSCGACHACSLGEVWLCANALAWCRGVHARRADDGADLHPGLNVAAFAEETVVSAACVLLRPRTVSRSPTPPCSAAPSSPATAPSITRRRSARARRSRCSASGEWASPRSRRPASWARVEDRRGRRVPREGGTGPRRRRHRLPDRLRHHRPRDPRPHRQAGCGRRRRVRRPCGHHPHRLGHPPDAAAAPRSSASAARTSRSPSTPWRSSTGVAPSPAASTATPTRPGTCRCWPNTSAPDAWSWAPWSRSASLWTASRRPSRTCLAGKGGRALVVF